MKRNLVLKIVALGLALVIWLQLTLMAEHQSRVKLNLKITNIIDGDSLLSAKDQISCVVQGRGIDIFKLRFSDAYIQMDANDLKSGNETEFEVIDIPPNLKLNIVSVDPNFIQKDGQTVNPDLERERLELASKNLDSEEKKSRNPSSTDNIQINDPVNTLILTDIPIAVSAGQKIFPTAVSLKVSGKASLLTKLPRGITIIAEEKPNPKGIFALKTTLPEGIVLVDMTPKQVHQRR